MQTFYWHLLHSAYIHVGKIFWLLNFFLQLSLVCGKFSAGYHHFLLMHVYTVSVQSMPYAGKVRWPASHLKSACSQMNHLMTSYPNPPWSPKELEEMTAQSSGGETCINYVHVSAMTEYSSMTIYMFVRRWEGLRWGVEEVRGIATGHLTVWRVIVYCCMEIKGRGRGGMGGESGEGEKGEGRERKGGGGGNGRGAGRERRNCICSSNCYSRQLHMKPLQTGSHKARGGWAHFLCMWLCTGNNLLPQQP